MLSWQRAFSFQKFSSKLLTPAVSQPARHTHELSPRHSPSLSLSFYLSLSLPFSLSLSLSFSFSLSVSLSLSLFLSRSPLLSSVRRQGKSCKKQIRRWEKPRMLPAWSDAVRYLERYPKSAEVDRPPDLESMAESIQNSCGKSRAAACARKCVLQAKWWASPTSLFSSRCSPAAAKLEWAISVVKGFGNGWALWGGKCHALHVAKLIDGYTTSRQITYTSHWRSLTENRGGLPEHLCHASSYLAKVSSPCVKR